jgi:hypothetical protein
LRDRRWHSSVFDVQSDHCLLVGTVWEILTGSQQAMQTFDMKKFNLKKLNEVQVTSNRFEALKNSDDDVNIIRVSLTHSWS